MTDHNDISESAQLLGTALSHLAGWQSDTEWDIASDRAVEVMVELGYVADDVTNGPDSTMIPAQMVQTALEIIALIAPDKAERIIQALKPADQSPPPMMGDITQFDFGHTVVQQVRSQFR